jgi:nucleoside-diphosphate-sugar epimerase
MSTQNSSTVLILGSRGRLGAALVQAFRTRGWNVLPQVRVRRAGDNQRILEADASDAKAVLHAFRGDGTRRVDVVVNACNPVYTRWATEAQPLNAAAIEITRSLDSTLMFPGNVYNFGADMGELLANNTPQRAETRKGRIRIKMEQQLADAATSGVQCIVIRAGDFFGCGSGSWFDLAIAKDLHRRKIVLPGRVDILHPWAYVPDLAETFVNVAEARAKLKPFECIHFAGHTLRLQTVIDTLTQLTRQQYKLGTLPWPIIRAFSFALPMWREIAELAYLWQRPHQLITAPEHRTLIAKQTPLEDAIRQSVRTLHPSLSIT